MRLYSYVVTYDTGFAPNPFFGCCTLACCKPVIRRTAKKDDWIVGLTPKAKGKGNKVLYYMRVDDVVESFADYWRAQRFQCKIPLWKSDEIRERCGDNIYEPKAIATDGYHQHPSMHSKVENQENADTKKRDLSCIRVLVSETFAYFGLSARDLPPKLEYLKVGRGHKCKFTDDEINTFVRFTKENGFGIFDAPSEWPQEDDSYQKDQNCIVGTPNCSCLSTSSIMKSCK
ncbi:MAG: hypothetical protein FWD64_00395 [Acidobacteriaceae bacterium]|nr:hypothetical protein [Acidobacteriaceae bacterium]